MGVKSISNNQCGCITSWSWSNDLWFSSNKKIQNYIMKKSTLFTSVIIAIIIFPQIALACATCYGNSDSAAVEGMNKAIFTMLGITGGVLSGVGSSIYVLSRRAKKHANSLPNQKDTIRR